MNKWWQERAWIVAYVLIFTLLVVLAFRTCNKVEAFDPTAPVLMETTAYTAGVAGTGTVTADGSTVRYGIVASSRERLGWTAIVYENNDGSLGDVIGIFEVKDIGYGKTEENGRGSIENETCLDVYMETLDDVWAWMARTDGKVWVQWVWCEG